MAHHGLAKKNLDVIVVGSGIAGLLLVAELSAKGFKTALVCKNKLSDSNTSFAQGGIAAVTGANRSDSVEKHLADTLAAGAGLTDERVAKLIVGDGRRAIERLESLGAYFDADSGGLELAREGGHSEARVLHRKDASGLAISQALAAHLRSCPNVNIYEDAFVFDLMMNDDRCIGVRLLVDGNLHELPSFHVVLATGGLGQVFSRTTNPAIATGDGIAMAYRAGAKLADMEFVQFHPTALALPGAPAFLISEAVRGAGAHLLDSAANRFAARFHPDAELATRDVVSRAIFSVMKEQGIPSVQLDLRPIGARAILHEFPNIVKACRNWGLDPLETPVPVSPAAHYFMGGILTDDRGCSSIPGLYAIGECASVGLHGANRLASNSLLEGAVMAMRLSETISGTALPIRRSRSADSEVVIFAADGSDATSIDQFRTEMWRVAGLVREGGELLSFLHERLQGPFRIVPLDRIEIESANMRLLGSIIARAAYNRCESRGAHWRSDYPMTDDLNYRRRYVIADDKSGWLDVNVPDAVFAGPLMPALVQSASKLAG